jgi:hypothetical protein
VSDQGWEQAASASDEEFPMVFWRLWRKCTVCDAEIGEPCRSLSGTVAGGRPDGIETTLPRPHRARHPRKGLIMPDKNSPKGDGGKAPTTGSNTPAKRDDKATSTGRPVDPKRPHTDR